MSTEVTFRDIARLEIERKSGPTCNNWITVRAFDQDGGEVGEVTFFPGYKKGAVKIPNVTSDFHIAITKQEEGAPSRAITKQGE